MHSDWPPLLVCWPRRSHQPTPDITIRNTVFVSGPHMCIIMMPTDTIATTVIGATMRSVITGNTIAAETPMIDGIGTTMADGIDIIITITRICITSCATVIATCIAAAASTGKRVA